MPITVPDSSWYRAKNLEAGVACSCPYANVHKCHRYYASIYMLGEVKIITSISDDKKQNWMNFGRSQTWFQSSQRTTLELAVRKVGRVHFQTSVRKLPTRISVITLVT